MQKAPPRFYWILVKAKGKRIWAHMGQGRIGTSSAALSPPGGLRSLTLKAFATAVHGLHGGLAGGI